MKYVDGFDDIHIEIKTAMRSSYCNQTIMPSLKNLRQNISAKFPQQPSNINSLTFRTFPHEIDQNLKFPNMEKFASSLKHVDRGHVIVIAGKSNEKAKKLIFNLQEFDEENAKNVMLQFAVRFDDKIIKRKMRINKKWLENEVDENLIMTDSVIPINPGETYKIAFHVESDMFLVSINDRPFCTFPRKAPLEQLKHLLISMDHDKLYQLDHLSAAKWSESTDTTEVSSLAPRRFKPGNVIVITAKADGQQGHGLVKFLKAASDDVLMQLRLERARAKKQEEVPTIHLPIDFEKVFKLAVGFAGDHCVFSLNGKVISSLPLSEISSNFYALLTGVKIQSYGDLKLQISSIDHRNLEPTCRNSEKLTFPKQPEHADEVFSSHLMAVESGHLFAISGKTKISAKSFIVDFASDNKSNSDIGDIPLRLWINFDRKGISRNSHFKDASWGSEEDDTNLFCGKSHNPFTPGDHFKISIYVDERLFFISLNEMPFCIYKFRHALSSIKVLRVLGDVEVICQADHVCARFPQWPPLIESKFSSIAPYPLVDNHVVSFVAEPQGSTKGSIELCLFESGSQRQMFNMKICYESKTIVAKSQRKSSGWSPEKLYKPEEFPFTMNADFKLAIGLSQHIVIVACNGELLLVFQTRDIDFESGDSAESFAVFGRDGLSLNVKNVSYNAMAACDDDPAAPIVEPV